jgi:hypothetical protein
MSFGSERIDDTLTGLALSGGGFRATLFHLGTLWRLNELVYLAKLDRISSISGSAPFPTATENGPSTVTTAFNDGCDGEMGGKKPRK